MLKKTAILSLVLITSSAFADLKSLDLHLKRHKAGWFTKESWITRLHKDDLKKIFGSNDRPENDLDFSVDEKAVGYSQIDWRNVNGQSFLGPVLNQGNCGSCVAFASVATLESQVSISAGQSWIKPSFSPQALFACGGGGCDSGWYPSSAANYIKAKGVVDLACAPYTSGSSGKDVMCSANYCQNQRARTFIADGVTKPTGGFGGLAQAVKDALKKGPLITSMTVYADFVAYGGGIYKSVSTESVGGHAISLVGYNDVGRYWIIRNSWGADWGEGGFARISYDDKSGVGSSTFGFTILPKDNYVSFEFPQENDYVTGNVQLITKFAKDVRFTIKLNKAGSLDFTTLGCEKLNDTKCINNLNTKTLADGKYELSVQALDNSKLFSTVRSFTVLNSVPVMNVSFVGATGVDLAKPVTGRIEFDITTKSSPVSIQKIDFLVLDSNGKVVSKRTTDVVLPKMKLGFRTNSVPNGKYDILYRATITVGGKTYTQDSNKFRITTSNKAANNEDTRGH